MPFKGTKHHSYKTNRIIIDPETGCHLWQLRINKDGYGEEHSQRRGRVILAHICEWEKVNGPVPEGFELGHTCRYRHCVNLVHLKLVTDKENARENNKNCKLTEWGVKFIKVWLLLGYSHREIAKVFGVSKGPITNINIGRNWKDVSIDA